MKFKLDRVNYWSTRALAVHERIVQEWTGNLLFKCRTNTNNLWFWSASIFKLNRNHEFNYEFNYKFESCTLIATPATNEMKYLPKSHREKFRFFRIEFKALKWRMNNLKFCLWFDFFFIFIFKVYFLAKYTVWICYIINIDFFVIFFSLEWVFLSLGQ